MVGSIAKVVSNVMLCYHKIIKIASGILNCLNLWPIMTTEGLEARIH